MGGPSKPKGPSKAELAAQQREQERLERERRAADAQAERDRQARLSETAARSGRNAGRRSLISGSELGTSDTLG